MNKKPKIYYTVETKFWRKEIGNKLDFLQCGGDIKDAYQRSVKEFVNESPIIAREKAFRYFQSIVDVLYEAKGKEFVSDEQARIDLQAYLNSGNDFELFGDRPQDQRTKISDDVFNGIRVFANIQDAKSKKSIALQIHSINYVDYFERPDDEVIVSLKGLIEECKQYETHSYPYDKQLQFLSLHSIGGKVESILKTPFNWDFFTHKHTGKPLV